MFRAAGVALLRGGGAAIRSATGAAKKAPAEKAVKAARAPTNPEAILRKYEVSAALSEFMGAKEVSRQEVTSKVWQHIRTHKLQNPEKKTEIMPDAALRKVLDADVLTFSTISKLLSQHFPKSTKPKATKTPRAAKAPKEAAAKAPKETAAKASKEKAAAMASA